MKFSLKQVLAVGALALASTAAFATATNTGVSDVGSNATVTPDSTQGYGGLTVSLFSTDLDNTLSMTAYLGKTLDQVIPTEMNTAGMTLTWDISDMLSQYNYSTYSSLVWGVNAGYTQGKTLVTTVNTTTGDTVLSFAQTKNAISNSNIVNQNAALEGTAVDYTTVASSGINETLKVGAGYGVNDAFLWTTDTNSTLAMYQYVAGSTTVGTSAATAYAGIWAINLSAGTLTYSVAGGSPVPVPAALWLLFSGLAGLGVVGRRKDA